MSQRVFLFALFATFCVVLLGMGLDIMEVDAAQYAGMSRDMVQRGDVLKLFFRDNDYLDKPPLLFWLSALSFKIFGVNEWSYRFPSVVFAFLGLFATFRFVRLYHEVAIARLATVILGCSTAFFLMTNDVRCDTILTGSVITAVWLGCAWLESGKAKYLVPCALAIGAAMLVKGPIGLITPVFALGGQVLFTGGWKKLRDPRLLIVPILIALALVPMCIGLYEQHGMHGIRFYFWEQSFGRITGENRWKDDSSAFYFTHELLWQLLPWTLFVLTGLWHDLKAIYRRERMPEYASISGAVLVFVAISLSQFKLPHYLYVALPFFAVLGARAVLRMTTKLAMFQYGLLFLLWAVCTLFVAMVFPEGRWPFVIACLSILPIAVIAFKRKGPVGAVPFSSILVMSVIGIVLNGHFYPNLLKYQANARAGQWAAANNLDQDHFFGLQISGSAMDYYAGFPVKWISNPDEARSVITAGVWIYTDGPRRDELLAAGLVPRSEKVLQNYPVQVLGLPFLFPKNRSSVVEDRFLLEY